MNVRDYNVGTSDYSKHKYQVWDMWIKFRMNPFDGDILKRDLRTKSTDPRKMDYEKIIHICKEMNRQKEEGIVWQKEHIVYPDGSKYDVDLPTMVEDYNLNACDYKIAYLICYHINDHIYDDIIELCEKRIKELS